MNHLSRLLALAALLLVETALAQDHATLGRALDVCTAQTLRLKLDSSRLSGPRLHALCDGSDKVARAFFSPTMTWLRYEFVTDGEFAFTVTAKGSREDIDFVVYRAPRGGQGPLEPVRCMFAGRNAGSAKDGICLGPTGLAATSTDTLELPGCSLRSDNFLAPVQIAAGDVVYLAVNAYAGPTAISVRHTGNASTDCPTSRVETAEAPSAALFPNLVRETLYLGGLTSGSERVEYEIIDPRGAVVKQGELRGVTTLAFGEYAAGVYYLHLLFYGSPSRVFAGRFVKL